MFCNGFLHNSWQSGILKVLVSPYLGSCLVPEILDRIKNNSPIKAAIVIQNIITIESKVNQRTG